MRLPQSSLRRKPRPWLALTLLFVLGETRGAAAAPSGNSGRSDPPQPPVRVQQPFSRTHTLPFPRTLEVQLPLGGRPSSLEGVSVQTENLQTRGVVLAGEPGLDRSEDRLVYRVRAESDRSTAGVLSMQIDLVRRGRVLRRFRIGQRFRIRNRPVAPEELDAWAGRLAAAQQELSQVQQELQGPKAYVDPTRQPNEAPKQKLSRLAAEVDDLRAALAAVARSKTDLAAARQATLAVVEATPRPSGANRRKASTAVQALLAAREAMATIQVNEAQAWLDAAHETTMNPFELARALELEAGLARMRSQEALATQLTARALTLVPDLKVNHPLPWVATGWSTERQRLAPDRALKVGRIRVTPVQRDKEEGLEVEVEFGPDMGRLVTRARVEFTDVDRVRFFEADHQGPNGVARGFVPYPQKNLQQVPMKVGLRTGRDHQVAELGSPRPVFVPLTQPARTKPKIAPWVWWVAGGAVLTGAAVAAGVAVADSRTPNPARGIGPFEIRF